MITPCPKCYETGYKCQECKDRNKKALSKRRLVEKTEEEISKGNQKTLR